MDEAQLEALRRLPPAETCRLIDFESAQIVTLESFPPQYVLTVTGTAPVFNMRVELVPLIYIQQPEYWGIEVVGCVQGPIVLPTLKPFSVALALAGVTGSSGVEVIGANRTEKLDVPPRESPLGSFSLSIIRKGVGVVGTASLTCSPSGGTHPDPDTACQQLMEANGYVENIPEDPGICTREFAPVTLKASGVWNGESREYCADFSNRCVGVRATGGVLFNFDGPLPGEATYEGAAAEDRPTGAR